MVRFPVGARDFFFPPKCPDRLWGPPSILFTEHRELLPTGERGWSVNQTTHLSSAEFKNTWSHASTPPHAFMVCSQLFAGFYNLNAIISITGHLRQQSYTMKTEQFSYFPKTRELRFRECTSPSLNDREGKKYMPTDVRAPATSKLHVQRFFQDNTSVWQSSGSSFRRRCSDWGRSPELHRDNLWPDRH